MNIALIVQAFQAALALAQEGTQIYQFLVTVVQKLEAVQATGADPTAQDWAYIDQVNAQYLTQLKGYTSLSAALLALPAKSAGDGTGG